jgi:hypothetical protein
LNVTLLGARSWFFRFMMAGEDHWMGLGSYPEVTLAKARELALDARRLVKSGVNPIAARRKANIVVPTFGKMADEVSEALSSGWRSDKHKAQWAMTLAVYAKPLRDMPVDQVDTEAVLSVLRPLWETKRGTASRLRGRIEKILDAAKAKGHRTGDNSAMWKGHLDTLLGRQQKLKRGHHAAMPYQEIAPFLAQLRMRPSVAALALEFAVLTAGDRAKRSAPNGRRSTSRRDCGPCQPAE